jgi:hypothetical protein
MPSRHKLPTDLRDPVTGRYQVLCRCYTRSHRFDREWISFDTPNARRHSCMKCFRKAMRSKPDLPQNVSFENLSIESRAEAEALLRQRS